MTDYVKITDYAGKDALTTGNPAKLVKGAEIGADFDAVVVAVASKADKSGATMVSIDINSGTIDGTTIGQTTPAAITGTTITANTGFVGAHNGTVGATTPAAITGTTITANTGFVGAHNGTVGATTPAAGTFTTITVNGEATTANGLTVKSAATGSNDGNVVSGTYTPTTGNLTNLTSATAAGLFNYIRVGNIVTVSGEITVLTIAAGGATTQMSVSLPVASNFGNSYEATGSGTVVKSTLINASVLANATWNAMAVTWLSDHIGSGPCYLHFTYRVI